MRTALSASGPLAALVLLAVTGCGPKLDDKRTVELAPGVTKFNFVDPIRSEQTITVTAKAGEPFNIYLFLEKDKAKIEKEADTGKVTSAMEKAEKTTDAKLSAKIPAGEGGAILMRSDKKTTVNLHITNR